MTCLDKREDAVWIPISILIALILLALTGYLVVQRKSSVPTDDEYFMMYFDDGLLELFFGLLLIGTGVMLDFYPAMIGILFALLYPFLLWAKRAITMQRLETETLPIDVARQRQEAMFAVLGGMLLLGILTILLFETNYVALRHWIDQYLMLTVIVVLASILSWSAYRAGVQRLYLYAGFMLAAYISSFWLDIAFPIYVILVGMVVFLAGLTMAVRFVHAHPKLV